MECKRLLLIEAAAAALFFVLRNSFLGISFLMTVISLLFLLAAAFTACFLPFKSRGVRGFCRIMLTVLSICTVFGFVSFVIVECNIAAGMRGDTNPENEFAIVLGAGIYGTRPSATLVSRLDKAYEFLSEYPESKAILSGGQGEGEDITEAEAMKRYLIDKGIAEDRLYTEQRSRSTAENIEYSFEILQDLTEMRPVKATIISNNFHLYRAAKLAGNIGIDAKTAGAPVPKIGLVPLSCAVREYFSVMFMYAKNII